MIASLLPSISPFTVAFVFVATGMLFAGLGVFAWGLASFLHCRRQLDPCARHAS